MTKQNTQPIQVSKEGKEFFDILQINAQAVLRRKITQAQAMELIAKFFKKNNDQYLKMMQEEINVKRVE